MFFSLNLNYVFNVKIFDRNFDIINRNDEIRLFDNNHDNLNRLNVKKINLLKQWNENIKRFFHNWQQKIIEL